MPSDSEIFRTFGLNNLLIKQDLKEISEKTGYKFQQSNESFKGYSDPYYDQIMQSIRTSAKGMAESYQIFFSLENSIRELISERLREEKGEDWWDNCIPPAVSSQADQNKKKEVKSGVTLRGDDMLSYTNFGDLGQIIVFNWDIFNDTFTDKNAVQNVIHRLNTIRAPIAHCCVLAEDEVIRLKLSVRDWFRLMA